MCEWGSQDGYEFVIGVANAAATPGWVRQMGFQLVQPLEARLGVGRLGIDLEAAAAKTQFQRVWRSDSLAWRCSNPNNPVLSRRRGDQLQFHAAGKGKILPVYAELPSHQVSGCVTNSDSFLLPWRLFLGLVPEGVCQFRQYVSIPQRFRPSPLNFVYRSLSRRVERLEKGSISFSFLNFDAY